MRLAIVCWFFAALIIVNYHVPSVSYKGDYLIPRQPAVFMRIMVA